MGAKLQNQDHKTNKKTYLYLNKNLFNTKFKFYISIQYYNT